MARYDVEEAKEVMTVDASLGERRRLMRHATKLKDRGGDHSKDEPWEVSKWLGLTDVYVQLMTVVWLVPKMILFVVPLFVLAFPVCMMARLFGCCLETGQDQIQGRWKLAFVVMPVSVPFGFVAFVALILDYLMYYIFSFPVFVLRCLACQARICGSDAFLRPYRGGPWILWYVNDVWIALVGQTLRHGVCESALKLACTVWYVPWIKYFINVNPLLYNLDERFVQQISTTTSDMKTTDVVATAKKLVNRTKNDAVTRKRLDASRFVPHYPYPPSGRDFHLGLQAGGTSLYASFLITHTTHALQQDSTKPRSSDYLIVSSSAEIPLWRVILWYNNPYHFFTGYVEASISNGKPSQRNKNLGFEHPMWLITAHSPLLSRRTSLFGPGFVDRFFDMWFPSFVSLVRFLVRGPKAELDRHQAVISQDGISRPKPRSKMTTVVDGHVVPTRVEV